ncbi:MAG: PhzF family phenazine biosynthesis protein [bacterium]
MKIKQYYVDAFTTRVFKGNPAAVCPLDKWLDDETLLSIAAENNLSETAFFIPSGKGFQLRWFTPVTEVDLCGHATLATAHVIFEILGYSGKSVTFETRSGDIVVKRNGSFLAMDFPAIPPKPCIAPDTLIKGLGNIPAEVLSAIDYFAVFNNEEAIYTITPDYARLAQLDLRGVIVTAPGRDVDFVSRFFAPKLGVPEDPVCGSAHCELTPYWAEKLQKHDLTAKQLSRRGGDIFCEFKSDRITLSGQAVTFMEAEIMINFLVL